MRVSRLYQSSTGIRMCDEERDLFIQFQAAKDIESLIVQFARNRREHHNVKIGFLRVDTQNGDCFVEDNQVQPTFNILTCAFAKLYRD